MTAKPWLDELERRFIDQRFWNVLERRIVATGRLLDGQQYLQQARTAIAEIKQSIALHFADSVELTTEDKKEIEKLFLSSLLGQRFLLPAKVLSSLGEPRRVGQLNQREVVCLWLGLFRQQTFGLAGLWQLYLDLNDETIQMYVDAETPDIRLPNLIRTIFADPQGREEENQVYISKILTEAHLAGLALTDQDTGKIMAWVAETRLKPPTRSTAELAADLQQRRSRAVNTVNQAFKRGSNIVMDELTRRVYDQIDLYQGIDHE